MDALSEPQIGLWLMCCQSDRLELVRWQIKELVACFLHYSRWLNKYQGSHFAANQISHETKFLLKVLRFGGILPIWSDLQTNKTWKNSNAAKFLYLIIIKFWDLADKKWPTNQQELTKSKMQQNFSKRFWDFAGFTRNEVTHKSTITCKISNATKSWYQQKCVKIIY